jgi:riboflavin synthase
MFTGIVEEIGTLRRLVAGRLSAELEVAAHAVVTGMRVGDSILTDGVCLTATAVLPDGFRADAMAETVRRTTLASLRPGAAINLERALALGDRLGGHLVTGHIDGVGEVRSVEREETALVLTIAAPQAVADLTVPQGSLAVAGVSLTVVDAAGSIVTVSLIPHTAAVTTLGRLRPGDRVNLEADLIGRYVAAFVGRAGEQRRGAPQPSGNLTWEDLRGAGL